MAKKATLTEFQPGRGYTREDWDEVDSPVATDEQLQQARPFAEAFPDLAQAIRKGGRPKAENPKVAVSLRLDQDVVAAFKQAGPGWQTRINAALKKAAGL